MASGLQRWADGHLTSFGPGTSCNRNGRSAAAHEESHPLTLKAEPYSELDLGSVGDAEIAQRAVVEQRQRLHGPPDPALLGPAGPHFQHQAHRARDPAG